MADPAGAACEGCAEGATAGWLASAQPAASKAAQATTAPAPGITEGLRMRPLSLPSTSGAGPGPTPVADWNAWYPLPSPPAAPPGDVLPGPAQPSAARRSRRAGRAVSRERHTGQDQRDSGQDKSGDVLAQDQDAEHDRDHRHQVGHRR